MLASELIEAIKRDGTIPENQDQFSDDKILRMATEILQTTIAAKLMKANEEFFVTEHEVPIIAGKRIRIPSRAISGTLRDVQLKRGTSISSLPQVNREDISSSAVGSPNSFYLTGNNIALYPSPATTQDSLLLPYCIRPSRLLIESEAGKIDSIAGNTVTLSSVPSNFLPLVKVDFIKGTSGYECVSIENAIISIVDNEVTFASLPDLEDGDWVALAGFSPVANIPEELHPVLVKFTAAKCLASMAQFDQSQILQGEARSELDAICALVTPRVIGEPQRITSVLF